MVWMLLLQTSLANPLRACSEEWPNCCTIHIQQSGNGKRGIVCLKCRTGPLCTVCHSTDHKGHRSIAVYICDQQPTLSVAVADLKDLMPKVDDLQVCSSSFESQVYLKEPAIKNFNLQYTELQSCRGCNGIVVIPFHYCSLTCKLRALRDKLHGLEVQLNSEGKEVSDEVQQNSKGKEVSDEVHEVKEDSFLEKQFSYNPTHIPGRPSVIHVYHRKGKQNHGVKEDSSLATQFSYNPTHIPGRPALIHVYHRKGKQNHGVKEDSSLGHLNATESGSFFGRVWKHLRQQLTWFPY